MKQIERLGHPQLFARPALALLAPVTGQGMERSAGDGGVIVVDGRYQCVQRVVVMHRFDIRGHCRIEVLVLAAQQVERGRHVGMYQRRQADAAVADDDGSDALTDLRQHLRRRQHDLVVVRMHVDEARCDDLASDVDHLGALRR